jgi:hypothetical protein
LGGGACTRAPHAATFDPKLRFQRLRSTHFAIYFHAGEEAIARRLAVVAEDVRQRVMEALGVDAPTLTHVILVDQDESANGWATPLPYDTIMVTAAWPSAVDPVGRVDDWLRVVFTHEFTHVVHLHQSRGWARLVHSTFGRVPLAFPNLFLPAWHVEGLATFEETRLTGSGRLYAGDFRAVELEAARTGRLEPLDRTNGGLTDWPGGHTPYVYGSGFHEYLAARFGADEVARLSRDTASAIPYTGSRTFRRVFGASLGSLWRDYQRTVSESVAMDPRGRVTRLTHHGFIVTGPRFAPPACLACPPDVVYSVRDPRGFPVLNAIAANATRPRQLATRYLGSTGGVAGDLVVFDQQEFHRSVASHSDLFVVDRQTGDVRALTFEGRLLEPDVSPDGRHIVCVREATGKRELVMMEFTMDGREPRVGDVRVLASEPDTQFGVPRWSPDGRLIAVQRHRRGSLAEIVVVDPVSRDSRVVATSPVRRIVTPAWRPDGQALVVAADAERASFNLYEISIGPGSAIRQLTTLSSGATWPDVSKDGETIVFVGYTPDGYDLFTMPYPKDAPAIEMDAFSGPTRQPTTETGTPSVNPVVGLATSSYSPWSTLRPTSWTPVIETPGDHRRIGAAIAGHDVLRYHAYAAAATWPTHALHPLSRAVPDWEFAYTYDRWQPVLFASLSRATTSSAPANAGVPRQGAVVENELEGGVIYPIRRARVLHRAVASALRSNDDYHLSSGAPSVAETAVSVKRMAVRGGWATTTARFYGYSISSEDGVSVGATGEFTRSDAMPGATAATATVDARAYLPGLLSHHVVALRASGGASWGAVAARRRFVLGGAESARDVLDFSGDAFNLLRGVAVNSLVGTRIALVNAEYRWPIARPQRGVGTWPVFFQTLHASAFADLGDVWTGDFHREDVRASFGGELSADVVVGYGWRLTVAVGAAETRWHGARSAAAYARVGRAF